jgi:hypothetical protein
MTPAESVQLDYEAPPRPNDAQGKPRCVGLELEIANLPLAQTLELVRGVVGGQVVQESATEGRVEDTRFGKFKVELDSVPLKERAYLKPLAALGVEPDSAVAQAVEQSVLEVAREIVPLEIVTPPIPWSRLSELDPLWSALRAAGAEDTRSSLLYAFGLHLNPVMPASDVDTLLSILRAFLLLEDWIVEDEDVDITRRIAPYIRPFPEAYRRMVLDPTYAPDFAAFVSDYVEHNPTRNRPLDMLPLFAHLGAPDLSERVSDWSLVGARPTFHYRLPNCDLAQPGWTPAADWNRWVMIERLASQRDLLYELSTSYLSTLDLPLRMQRGGWTDHVRTRLDRLGGGVALPVGG